MTFEEFIEEEKERDPEFRRVWEEGEPEFQVIRMVVGTRSRRGWTQQELARRMGTDRATLSRAETTGKVTPAFLARFAAAAGGDVTLSIKVPGQRRLSLLLSAAPGTDLDPLDNAEMPAVRGRTRRRSFTFRRAQGPPRRSASPADVSQPVREAEAPATPAVR